MKRLHFAWFTLNITVFILMQRTAFWSSTTGQEDIKHLESGVAFGVWRRCPCRFWHRSKTALIYTFDVCVCFLQTSWNINEFEHCRLAQTSFLVIHLICVWDRVLMWSNKPHTLLAAFGVDFPQAARHNYSYRFGGAKTMGKPNFMMRKANVPTGNITVCAVFWLTRLEYCG